MIRKKSLRMLCSMLLYSSVILNRVVCVLQEYSTCAPTECTSADEWPALAKERKKLDDFALFERTPMVQRERERKKNRCNLHSGAFLKPLPIKEADFTHKYQCICTHKEEKKGMYADFFHIAPQFFKWILLIATSVDKSEPFVYINFLLITTVICMYTYLCIIIIIIACHI